METTPLMLISQGGPVTSLVQSNAGVAASVPVPAMGQIGGLGGLSVLGIPVERLVAQVVLCHTGGLSL